MIYRVIGLMSGSSLDGLDIVFAEILEDRGSWSFEIMASDCYAYDDEWKERLRSAPSLSAYDYQLLHTGYGHYTGALVNRFIEENGLQFKVALIASHGHTTFHVPALQMTAQLGDGAAIAAATGLPVVSDLRALDVAFGGQGAPIVPIGEKLLFSQYPLCLNLGGIANISYQNGEDYLAFDVCPANRVLNALAQEEGKEYDAAGEMASSGQVDEKMLAQLNELDYYRQPFPKSLANEFGTQVVLPFLQEHKLPTTHLLRTYVEHIAVQVRRATQSLVNENNSGATLQMLVTGGGAFNSFLVTRISEELKELGIEAVVPEAAIINYKEAIVMALIGVLRWRQEYNVMPSVTGASRASIGGALWNGQEA